MNKAVSIPGLVTLPMDIEIALHSQILPGEFHADPADRIIVSTAKLHSCTLVTADGLIQDYAVREKLSIISV